MNNVNMQRLYKHGRQPCAHEQQGKWRLCLLINAIIILLEHSRLLLYPPQNNNSNNILHGLVWSSNFSPILLTYIG